MNKRPWPSAATNRNLTADYADARMRADQYERRMTKNEGQENRWFATRPLRSIAEIPGCLSTAHIVPDL